MAPAAFVMPALPVRSCATSRRSSALRCAVSPPEVDQYFPAPVRSKAPHISFDGEQGVRFSMQRVAAFTEDTGEEPLFNYDEKDWAADKPTPPSAISWPSGDGRGVPMSGTRGSFNQGDLSKYGPFPDFLKRSCDL